MILNNILEAIGNTPIVRLDKVGSELRCNLFAKCEYINPGGSVKDRIGFRMIDEAEKSGRIKPGDTLIEPSSGNTGIGLALAAAVKGYKLIITMPEKMSMEKEVVLEALGAKIIRTPTDVAHDDPKSLFSVAKQLQKDIPNSHILDQYSNNNNPDAHYNGTAQEILDEFGEDLDMVVISTGTGGTITGIAKKLKESISNIEIVGIDPIGSILGGGSDITPYHVEGIGYDFFPDVLDNSLVDRYIKTSDEDSFAMARKLIQEEGLLIGGSCGAAVWGAIEAAKNLDSNKNVLVILPDSIRNYLSKFVNNKWMTNNGFKI
ncbi:MAG: pyridoxal-phosphate dependent enzyme [Candidatus Neomarinimicrobiota bacterium]|nr:pyridoxal-phosphate dependent enzyme [Candidatus Neomarinimicrobiota bacterium]|tara:strand:+ start:2287 stop:3240 length:954 start_codon:yes stop_codon:yes gene_type:complete